MAYNGWSNKETWLVNVWLGDSLTMMQEDGYEITAEFIEEMVDDQNRRHVNDGFIQDLLNCALGEIDYHELAEHYDEEVVEDA